MLRVIASRIGQYMVPLLHRAMHLGQMWCSIILFASWNKVSAEDAARFLSFVAQARVALWRFAHNIIDRTRAPRHFEAESTRHSELWRTICLLDLSGGLLSIWPLIPHLQHEDECSYHQLCAARVTVLESSTMFSFIAFTLLLQHVVSQQLQHIASAGDSALQAVSPVPASWYH
jgi:hypothetical protein